MSTPYIARPLSAPATDVSTEKYQSFAREGYLSSRRCKSCNKLHWYPRPLCPFCQGETEWERLSGLGTIYSASVTRKAGPIAYAIAYVTLDEGPTMLTNIVDCDLDSIHIGQRVKVCFKQAEGEDNIQVPMFTPAE
nr:OB-fold domain-containing protein [uncultured Cupriavidus sp.]